MAKIELLGEIEDGTITIKVPKKHLKDLKEGFRVIIVTKEKAPQKKLIKKGHFSSIKIKTKGFKFNREEANER